MAKKYCVCVDNWKKRVYVTVATLIQATGLASTNLLKGRSVTITPAHENAPVSFRTTAAAQAFIEVELFELTAKQVA